MSQGIHKAHTSRLVIALLAAFFAVTAMVLTASPAHAHDELLSSDPAADSTLDALPTQIDLTFSANVASDEGATEIAVTDADGTSLVADPPTVLDNVVTQTLLGDASGEITVLWKVVSSDGHPISGDYTFTVAAPTPTATASASPSASTSASAEPSASASPSETVAPVPAEDGGSLTWMWVVGGIIVAALAGAVLYLVTSRARREKALSAPRSDSSTDR